MTYTLCEHEHLWKLPWLLLRCKIQMMFKSSSLVKLQVPSTVPKPRGRTAPCVRRQGRTPRPCSAVPAPPPARLPGRPPSGRRRLGGASAPAIRPRCRRPLISRGRGRGARGRARRCPLRARSRGGLSRGLSRLSARPCRSRVSQSLLHLTLAVPGPSAPCSLSDSLPNLLPLLLGSLF